MQSSNAALLQEARATVVFLDAPVDELYRRCALERRERPLRQDREQFRELYESRRPHYAAGTMRIETGGKEVNAIADEVARGLGLEKDSGPSGVTK